MEPSAKWGALAKQALGEGHSEGAYIHLRLRRGRRSFWGGASKNRLNNHATNLVRALASERGDVVCKCIINSCFDGY
jgi:hypothetical protein